MPSTVGTPTQGSFTAASVTPTAASGYAAGDALLCVVSQDGTGTLTVNAGSSSGWAKLGQWTSAAATTTAAAFYKKNAAGPGSDGLIVDSTVNERGTYILQPITGQDTATDAYIEVGLDGPSGTNVCNPPNLNPTGASQAYLWVAVGGGSANVNATAAPTNYSGLLSQSTTTSSCSTWLGFRELTAVFENPGVFTHAATAWQANTIAVPPAAAGGVTYEKTGSVIAQDVVAAGDTYTAVEEGAAIASNIFVAGADVFEAVEAGGVVANAVASGVAVKELPSITKAGMAVIGP